MADQDPKSFYRKLDKLLSKIQFGSARERSGLISSVLEDIVESFGAELKIRNGRLYDVSGGELILSYDLRSPEEKPKNLRIPLDYPPIQFLFEHRCYIFDASTPGLDPEYEQKILGGTMSVAIVVGRETEWVLAFGLAEGWDRETIEFSMNTIRHALTRRLEAEGREADMEEAVLIQRSLFPKRPPEFEGFEIAGRAETAGSVGGDFYDFIPLDDEAIGIATGDASGHGLPAALLVRDVVTGLRMGVERDMKITPILRRLNAVIHRSTLSTKFVSLFYGELESNGNLMYVNAGHIAPYVLQDRGTFRLDQGGSILGPLPDIRFKRGFMHLDKGGLFVAVSDGIVERVNGAGEQFGDHKLGDLLDRCRDMSAPDVLAAVFDEAQAHGRDRWEDDATVIAVRRLP